MAQGSRLNSMPGIGSDPPRGLRPTRRDRILARRIDPTHEQYDPHIPSKRLAQDAGEAEANVCRWLKQWESGLYDREGRQTCPAEMQGRPGATSPWAPERAILPRGGKAGGDPRAGRQLHPKVREAKTPPGGEGLQVELKAKEELTGERAPSRAQVRSVLRRVPYQTLLAWAGGIEELKKSGGLPRLVMDPPPAPNIEWYGDQWVADIFVRVRGRLIGAPRHLQLR